MRGSITSWWQSSGLEPGVEHIANATIARVLPWMVVATGVAALLGAAVHILFLEPGFRPWIVPTHLLYTLAGVVIWHRPPRHINLATTLAGAYLTFVLSLYILLGEFTTTVHFGILLVGGMYMSLDRRLLAALSAIWIVALVAIAVRWMPSSEGITVLVLSLISFAGGLALRRMRLASVEQVVALQQQLEATIQQREDAVERAQSAEKMESLGVMAAGVAHDYNNLLVGVIGGVDLASMARTEAEREMALETIRASAASLTALSSQLLEVSGGRPINKERVDLNEVVERTLAAVAADPAIDSRIRTQLASDLPLVEGEPASLQQVVLNLVTNALKAGTHTDGAVVVTTQTTPPAAGRSNPGVLLGVQDDGPGVPAEYRNRVFDPFFTTSDSGRGLGLATARTITLRHDGEIRLVPRPIGVRFDVSFPGIPRQASAISSAPTQLTDEPQGDLSLLLVDDDDAVRAVTARMLSRMRYQVLEADSGPLAVELFQSKRPSLAIVDAIMPGMDGVETIKALRAIDPELKVLLYSGYHYAADTKELPAGVGFLPKPFNTTQLTAALASLINRESAVSEG